MLEEAVASMRGSGADEEGQWSPQINVGTPVLIPESYVPDLDARMALYRRLSDVETRSEIDGFAAELIDRFGKLPEEVEFLLKIVVVGCSNRFECGRQPHGNAREHVPDRRHRSVDVGDRAPCYDDVGRRFERNNVYLRR